MFCKCQYFFLFRSMTMVMHLKLFRQVARISSPHSFSTTLPAVGDVLHINHFTVSIVHFLKRILQEMKKCR